MYTCWSIEWACNKKSVSISKRSGTIFHLLENAKLAQLWFFSSGYALHMKAGEIYIQNIPFESQMLNTTTSNLVLPIKSLYSSQCKKIHWNLYYKHVIMGQQYMYISECDDNAIMKLPDCFCKVFRKMGSLEFPRHHCGSIQGRIQGELIAYVHATFHTSFHNALLD